MPSPSQCSPSRGQTLRCALERLGLVPRPAVSNHLVVHCLGAEGPECNSEAHVRSLYADFFVWLAGHNVGHVELLFVGPSISEAMAKINSTFHVQQMVVHVSAVSAYYHDFWQHSHPDSGNIDLLMLYNAGLWGYDSWTPTLKLFAGVAISPPEGSGEPSTRSMPRGIPVVVTSYTQLEAEEDYEAVVSAFGGATRVSWAWEDEPNPHADTVDCQRQNAHGLVYLENHSWMAFYTGALEAVDHGLESIEGEGGGDGLGE